MRILEVWNLVTVAIHVFPHRWQETKGEKATPKALTAALCEMKLMSIVHQHFEGV